MFNVSSSTGYPASVTLSQCYIVAYFEIQIQKADVQLGVYIPTVILTILREVCFSQGVLRCDLNVKGTKKTWTFPLRVTHSPSRKEELGS